MKDHNSFWCAEGAPDNTIIYKVDPRANIKTPLFDTQRLRDGLASFVGQDLPGKGLPFSQMTFIDESERKVKFKFKDKEYIVNLDDYNIVEAPKEQRENKARFQPRIARKLKYRPRDVMELLSPDRRWFATLKDHNLCLRSTEDDQIIQITNDGIDFFDYSVSGANWSPDSHKLAFLRVDNQKVRKRLIVDWLGETEKVDWVPQTRPGGPYPKMEVWILDVPSKRLLKVDRGEGSDGYVLIADWRPDGSELLLLAFDYGYKQIDLLAVNPETGKSRKVVSEDLFLDFPWVGDRVFPLPGDNERFIWLSGRDGWSHLYLYKWDGTLIRQLTKGEFDVRSNITIDENRGWIYFQTNVLDKKRPYDNPLCRVNFEGEEFKQLTPAIGAHSIEFSPSKEFFLDTHSHHSRPPIVELRRTDGTLIRIISEANIDSLIEEVKWTPKEEFVVKAADGKTDLYGLLCKPPDFDPNEKYPVIAYIYTTFYGMDVGFLEDLALRSFSFLGCIAYQVWERGSEGRGREFRKLAYRNIGRYEIPDYVAALKQLAEERPYMDLNRVGVFGGSHGGWGAIRAMLQAPDVFHVGVAERPDVDLFEDDNIEFIMDSPQNNPEGYEYASNLWLAKNLKGKLLIVHHSSDIANPLSATMKMCDAFIREKKYFDLLIIPGATHWDSPNYSTWFRYFWEHLINKK
jgi:dipeptidyl aminopeptidase/acylaminoacyl peptidase